MNDKHNSKESEMLMYIVNNYLTEDERKQMEEEGITEEDILNHDSKEFIFTIVYLLPEPNSLGYNRVYDLTKTLRDYRKIPLGLSEHIREPSMDSRFPEVPHIKHYFDFGSWPFGSMSRREDGSPLSPELHRCSTLELAEFRNKGGLVYTIPIHRIGKTEED